MPAPANLVHQTTTGTGTSNLTLAAVNGKQSFATAFGTGVTTDVFDYFISNRDAAEWERGTGHMSDATTLVRDTVIESSNSDLAVNFSAGIKDVTNDVPAASQITSQMFSAPPQSDTWHWGGDVAAKFHQTTSGGSIAGGVDAASATLPEFIAQFGMTSAVGSANPSSAYKVALAPWMVANLGSANAYAFNSVLQAGAGFDKLAVAGEFDINNNSGFDYDFSDLGTGVDIHGVSIVSAGANWNSAAVWIVGSSPVSKNWSNGIALTGANTINSADASSAAFNDATQGYNVIRAIGTHTNGVNFFGAAITGGAGTAFIAPNGNGLGAANAAGNANLPLIYLDNADKVQIGTASVVGIQLNNDTKISAAVAGSGAADVVNSNAAAGDIGLTLRAGTNDNTDGLTNLFLFTTPDTLNVLGGVSRNSGGFTVSYNTSSDARLKEDLRPVEDALELVSRIQAVSARWAGQQTENRFHTLLAQQLYDIAPYAVRVGGDDPRAEPWQVDYGKLVPLLISAVQALSARLETLEGKSVDA